MRVMERVSRVVVAVMVLGSVAVACETSTVVAAPVEVVAASGPVEDGERPPCPTCGGEPALTASPVRASD